MKKLLTIILMLFAIEAKAQTIFWWSSGDYVGDLMTNFNQSMSNVVAAIAGGGSSSRVLQVTGTDVVSVGNSYGGLSGVVSVQVDVASIRSGLATGTPIYSVAGLATGTPIYSVAGLATGTPIYSVSGLATGNPLYAISWTGSVCAVSNNFVDVSSSSNYTGVVSNQFIGCTQWVYFVRCFTNGSAAAGGGSITLAGHKLIANANDFSMADFTGATTNNVTRPNARYYRDASNSWLGVTWTMSEATNIIQTRYASMSYFPDPTWTNWAQSSSALIVRVVSDLTTTADNDLFLRISADGLPTFTASNLISSSAGVVRDFPFSGTNLPGFTRAKEWHIDLDYRGWKTNAAYLIGIYLQPN